MAEEFYMSVSFEMPDVDHMAALETLIEHFDLCETEEARRLLSQQNLASAEQLIENLTSHYSNYVNGYDLVRMYAETYDDSVDDLDLKIGESGLSGEITVDGHDHEADDFCAALILILVAMGAGSIHAKAGAPMWNATWFSKTDGKMEFNFDAEE
jgi:hypothetical protein